MIKTIQNHKIKPNLFQYRKYKMIAFQESMLASDP